MSQTAVNPDVLPATLKAALTYWQSLPNDGIAPSWAQFDLMGLPYTLIPTTAVIDIADEIRHSTFRFWGSRLSLTQGHDMTGRSLGDLSPPTRRDSIIKAHKWVVRNRLPSTSSLGHDEQGEYIRMQIALRLPLSSDGETVDKIVVCVDYSAEARRLIQESRDRYFEAIDSRPDDPPAP